MTKDIGELHLWLTPSLDFIEPPKELTPYQKLFIAILMDAIGTLKKLPTGPTGARYVGQRKYHTRHDKQIKIDPIADAWAWLMSDGEDEVFGFVSICEYFGWDSKRMRKQALEAIQKAKEQPNGCRRNLVATDGKRRRKQA